MNNSFNHLSGLLALSPEWASRERLTDFEARMRGVDVAASYVQAMDHLTTVAAVNFRQVATSDALFVRAGATAVIPVWGVLVNRFSYVLPWATGYNYIRDAVNAAVSDPDVARIILDINSPGGDVAGLPETAAAIKTAAQSKPVTAMVDSLCASAAYWLASTATEIVATTSSMVGSIGVLWQHYSYARLLDKAGVDVTFVYAGDQKATTWPEQQLTDATKARTQARVDSFAADFYSAVATNRNMTADAVKALEAAMFRADEALAEGLIDAVLPPEQTVGDFLSQRKPEGTNAMTTNTQPGGAVDPAKIAADTSAAVAAALAAERTRVAAIMGSEPAKTRQKLAATLAAQDMSLEVALTVLSAAAEEAAPVAKSPLDVAMDRSGGGAGIGAGNEPGSGKTLTEAEEGLQIYKDWAAARNDDPLKAHLRN